MPVSGNRSGSNGVVMNQMNWLEWEYKRRLRQARWFFFILGLIFGFVFGLMADGAHSEMLVDISCYTA